MPRQTLGHAPHRLSVPFSRLAVLDPTPCPVDVRASNVPEVRKAASIRHADDSDTGRALPRATLRH